MGNKILLLFSFLTVAAGVSKASDPNPNNLSFTEQMELAMRLSQQESASSANSNASTPTSQTASKAAHELTFTEQMELAMRLSQQESSTYTPAPFINSNTSSSTSSAVKNAVLSSVSSMSYAEQMRLALKQSEEEARVAELKRIEEEDRKLALQLAGGQATRTNSSSNVEDSYNAFVRQFEEQERLNNGSLNGIRIATKDYPNLVRLFKSRIETLEKQKVDINALRFIYNEYKRTVPAMDSNPQSVHTFNLQFVNSHASKVMSLEQVAIKSAKNIPFDNVVQAVRGFLGINNQHHTDQQAQVLKALSMLKAYLIETPIDTETGLNMAHLLSQVYDLVQHCDATRNIFSLPNGTSVDAMGYFIYSLQENLTTQGGCKPGMAGRLFRDYLLFSSSILELREKDLLRQIEIYRRHVADFQ